MCYDSWVEGVGKSPTVKRALCWALLPVDHAKMVAVRTGIPSNSASPACAAWY